MVNHNPAETGRETKSISREHTVIVRPEGLVTVTGGKWTTYRSMAEDVLDRCGNAGLIALGGPCVSAKTQLGGATGGGQRYTLAEQAGPHSYGSEANVVEALPGADRVIAPGLTEAMARFAVRYEFARNVEDVLARRSRLLFLDAKAAMESADAIAEIIESETEAPSRKAEFKALAKKYLHPSH
ncbi:glycerol-3-phosphate dehydrogenase C-terminal domain-containing protein [Variovorax sp. Root411]|uniref:glycerol-3-phosphate dehydrogenase C-terminal domain-containing protein n=1 Tax=Variovorax sp. Root411 TaxID=1736530 RepID=UPI00138F70C1|nr:glycerol-3-phosphate dehydrogenase C-terminal domain-containing protein [Variovorax sp. Root411]